MTSAILQHQCLVTRILVCVASLQIVEEVQRVVGDGPLTYEKLGKLEYTTQVLITYSPTSLPAAAPPSQS